jgi:hypothetical protein
MLNRIGIRGTGERIGVVSKLHSQCQIEFELRKLISDLRKDPITSRTSQTSSDTWHLLIGAMSV